MKFAFDEFNDLLIRLRSPISEHDPIVRYLCALVSELTYHHVPKFEMDERKRIKAIPCDAFQKIVNSGTPTDVRQYLQEMESPESFVIEGRGVIAVGVLVGQYLFIGFRGTAFLYDWKVNIRASLAQLNSCSCYFSSGLPVFGRVHKGFLEETMRVCTRLIAEKNDQIHKANRVFLTGHSLGGAVAALANMFFAPDTLTCVFGTPRYCDQSYCLYSRHRSIVHVERSGDIVPSVPPKWMGYTDHLYQLHTRSMQTWSPIQRSGWRHFYWCLALFLGKRLQPHNVEGYRKELGPKTGASLFEAELVPNEKLSTLRQMQNSEAT